MMFSVDKLNSVAQLEAGQTGVVKLIDGGQAVTRRLQAMGIRIGKKVRKLSGMFMRGPVTLEVGRTQIAVGHGMASKIMVEIEQ